MFPHLQGEAVLFITTNFITTPNQKLGYCAEVRHHQTVKLQHTFTFSFHINLLLQIGAVLLVSLPHVGWNYGWDIDYTVYI